jgi:hypothetical protein
MQRNTKKYKEGKYKMWKGVKHEENVIKDAYEFCF